MGRPTRNLPLGAALRIQPCAAAAMKQRYDSDGFRAVNFSAKNRMEEPVYAGLALQRGANYAASRLQILRPAEQIRDSADICPSDPHRDGAAGVTDLIDTES